VAHLKNSSWWEELQVMIVLEIDRKARGPGNRKSGRKLEKA